MNRAYFKWIVALAALCVLIVAFFMWSDRHREDSAVAHLVPRIVSPFPSYISAVGVVEASKGNILIGSPVNRIVDKVYVSVGQKVKDGDILFSLEAHDLYAELAARTVDFDNSVANVKKLEALPRKEDVEIAQAQRHIAEAEVEQAKSQYQRVTDLQNNGAMSQEEVARRRFALMQAEAKLQQSQAEFDKVFSGAWSPDLEIARLKVKQATAAVEHVEADIDRTIIRAPSDATILQIKIHEGEFPPSNAFQSPAMVIGNTDTLSLRVSINQFDASYYNPEAPAVAYLQGNARITFPLTFRHIEPLFVNKQNLTNDINEKVDTRVLQAIYCFEEGESRVFVGQQMDVFIETPNVPPEKGL